MKTDVESKIELMIDQARRSNDERRACSRLPFFHPVLVRLNDHQELSAFTRDISDQGVGLLHCFPIEPQAVTVITRLDQRSPRIELPARLVWCRPCGEGWFISGGEFSRDAKQ